MRGITVGINPGDCNLPLAVSREGTAGGDAKLLNVFEKEAESKKKRRQNNKSLRLQT